MESCARIPQRTRCTTPFGRSWKAVSARIILVSHVATVARQTYLDSPAGASRTGCLHPSAHQICSGSSWLDTGWLPRGWRHSSCMPVPTCQIQCFLDSGIRRCCKVGHSCMRRVIDGSSVPHKMAWRNVARAIRTVSRLGGPGCEFIDVSQLRSELDSMFQELDTAFAVLLEVRLCHVRRSV